MLGLRPPTAAITPLPCSTLKCLLLTAWKMPITNRVVTAAAAVLLCLQELSEEALSLHISSCHPTPGHSLPMKEWGYGKSPCSVHCPSLSEHSQRGLRETWPCATYSPTLDVHCHQQRKTSELLLPLLLGSSHHFPNPEPCTTVRTRR